MSTDNLSERIATLPELLGSYTPPTRAPPLPYNVSAGPCISCGTSVSGDWGLVPDECDRCYSEGLARHELRKAEAALARLALAREWIADAHRWDCDPHALGDCTCGRDALLKAMEVPR